MKSKLVIIFYILITLVLIGTVLACSNPGHPAVPDPNPDSSQSKNNDDDPNKETKNNPSSNEKEGGDPVRLVNGKFAYSATDLVIKGRKLGIAIQRFYQNNYTTSGTVTLDGSGSYDPDGRIVRYEWKFQQPAYDVSGASTANPSCKFTVPGTYGGSYRVLNDHSIWSNYVSFNVTVSADIKTSRFGYNWDMNYNLKAVEVNETSLIFYDGQNHRIEYSKVNGSSPAKYIGPAHISDYFLKENGLFTQYEKSGMKYKFDSDGCLWRIEDLYGNAVSFSYSGSGLYKKLNKITDDLNRSIALDYNGDGLLYKITDSNDRIWTYTYDSATNNLLSITTPDTNDYPNGLKKEYTYDPRHNIQAIKDANGQVWLANTYDSLDRVITQTVGDANYTFIYDPNNGKTAVTDRKGNINTVYYDSLGNTVRSIDSNSAGLDDPCSLTTSYEYDSNTEKVSKVLLPGGNWINYQYDSNGNVAKMTTEPNDGEANIITSYTYQSKFDFVATITDANNNVTTFDYNESNGNLISITYPTVATADGNVCPVIRFTYNEHGQAETMTSPDGIVTEYVYYDGNDVNDPNCGRLWKIIADANETQGLKITTEYKYDIYGNVINVKDANGNITELAYNRLNLLTQTKSPAGDVTKLSYNVNKMLAQIENLRTGDSNQITKYAYNKMDKLRATIDALSNITRFSYDASENLSDVNDAENNITHYEYDKRNLLSKTIDANGNATEYSYTPNGQLAKIKDANGSETTYHYDGFGRLKWGQYPCDTNEVYSYDKTSNVASFKNRGGQTISYTYDALSRIRTKTRPGEEALTYTYDIAGRLCDVKQGTAALASYSYDRIGRMISVTDEHSKIVGYNYDILSRRTKLVYPDDTNVTYEYDSLSRPTKVKYQNQTMAEYKYDQLGRRTLLTYGNDANIVYQYDIGDRLTRITNNTNSGPIDIQYSDYDKVGNRKNMIISGSESQYSYDKLYQLTGVDYPAGFGADANYYYDCLGSRRSVVEGSATNYSRNNLNQYTAVGVTSYSYDSKGNLINDGTYKYYYDCENRLIDVNGIDNSRIAHYTYDFAGRRISKTLHASQTTIHFAYDGDDLIAEYSSAGTLIKKYIYGPGIDEPVCMIDAAGGGAKYYYHFDGLGSVVALSNNSGNIIEQYHYDVFGTPSVTSSVGNRFMFTGRELDVETGNYYYRARYYKPSIGRFLQTDPIGYGDSMNLYQYGLNDPVNCFDPYGENVFGGFVGWIAGSGWDNSVDMGWSEAGTLAGAAISGAGDGAIIAADAYTFGMIDPLNKAASEKVSEYGAAGKASQFCARVSRDAAIAAVTAGASRAGNAAKAAKGGMRAVNAGRAGESAVGINGPKKAVEYAGKKIFPDQVTKNAVREVKNVAKQSLTKQLRTYSAFAKENGMNFEMYTRSTTQLSKPLKQAIDAGSIIHKYIPGM